MFHYQVGQYQCMENGFIYGSLPFKLCFGVFLELGIVAIGPRRSMIYS